MSWDNTPGHYKDEEDLSGEFLFVWFEEVRGDFAEVPDEAAPGEGFERVVGDVNFPPEESLIGGTLIVVVVVVPTLA